MIRPRQISDPSWLLIRIQNTKSLKYFSSNTRFWYDRAPATVHCYPEAKISNYRQLQSYTQRMDDWGILL